MGLLKKLFNLFANQSKDTTQDQKEKSRDNFFQKVDAFHQEKISIRDLVDQNKTKNFFAIDLETTGLSAQKDRIIEIGVVHFSNSKITDQFNTLINPGFPIPKEASRVNHITDEMVKHAPKEKLAISNMMKFLKKESKEEIILCAHNADFDIGFLVKALNRCRISTSFVYVDTLKESRTLLPTLNNYKLGTIAKRFGIVNAKAHRATEDATVCGFILNNLIEIYLKDYEERIKLEQEHKEKSIPKGAELTICAGIFLMISKKEPDLSLLRFYRHSSNYVSVDFYYDMFKFKFAKKGRYIILPREEAISSGFPTERATMSEGGSEYLRAYFNSPEDLNRIQDFILKSYKKRYREYSEFKKDYGETSFFKDIMDDYWHYGVQMSKERAQALLEEAENMPSVFDLNLNFKENKQVDTSNIVINPDHNRVPLSQIQNADDWDKGYDLGFPFWEKGDAIRKNNKTKEAIILFDKARYKGYNAPSLYWSYALAYRKLKDYDNEVAILNEGIERLFPNKESDDYSRFEGRRQKALELLVKKREQNEKSR